MELPGVGITSPGGHGNVQASHEVPQCQWPIQRALAVPPTGGLQPRNQLLGHGERVVVGLPLDFEDWTTTGLVEVGLDAGFDVEMRIGWQLTATTETYTLSPHGALPHGCRR